MITLFTGMPGAGKTAALVQLLAELPGDRPIYVDGLEGLTLPHHVCNADEWHEQLPDGAILVVDEAQRVWRPRGPAARVPPSVSEMETHRHRGIDIFLTTQSPRLIDANVRGLVGRHVHIRDTGWLGRWWYEWPETNEGVAWKTCPVKKRYKLPSKIFDLYKSASIHTKPERMTPKTVFLVLFLLLCLGVLVFMISRSFRQHAAPADKPAAPVSLPAAQPAMLRTTANTLPDERVDFIPRISDRPWTAPAYDHLRQVVRMPVITGAVCVNDDCVCYNGKEKLMDVTSSVCRSWLVHRPFNPYVPEPDSNGGRAEANRSFSPDQTPPAPGLTSAAGLGVGHVAPL